uniref:TOG domain-containing protein n=1 Tax=Panagrolaimus sp. PS1159 TaxID=55785 RepID=A0AC35GIP9_9BILA
MDDGWDFADPVDILPQLPQKFEATVASKKWQERKKVLEALLQLATDNIKLDPKANYNEIVGTLTKILSKDANIYVCAVAAKCITQLAKGLRSKFASHAPSIIEVIFEKFKEKKALLRDPLIEASDAIYATTTIEAVSENVVAALGKPNPNIKIQTNLFLYRVFKASNARTAPKKVVKTLTPLIAKCTGESDAATREAAFSALGAIMKAIGKNNAMTVLGDVANDKTKMAHIRKFHNQAVEEAKKAQQASESSQPLTTDQSVKKIIEGLKESKMIDRKIWALVRSSKEKLMAFERFLKSADIAVIDKEVTVTFGNGLTLTFTDSDHPYTKEVYQWIASRVKTVKFAPTAHHSELLRAITDRGSPKSVSFGYQGQRAATIASPLIIRCFDSILTLECPASELANYDFHGGIMKLNLLKVVAKSEAEIRIVLQKKNIQAKSIEILLTTLKPGFFFGNLLLAFNDIKNPRRLQAVESIRFMIDRFYLTGPLYLLQLAKKCQEIFRNLQSFEFGGFTAHRTNMDLHVPTTQPKFYLELKEQIMEIDPALKVDVGWNILEFYKPSDFKAAVTAYRNILADFEEDPESDMNIMMSKKETLSENKNLYTEFYIMYG